MALEFQKMPTEELTSQLKHMSQPRPWTVAKGRATAVLWPFLFVIVPFNVMQCIWATQYHSNDNYHGMPMILLWIWFSLVSVALAVAEIGWVTAGNKKQLQALTELLLRQKEGL